MPTTTSIPLSHVTPDDVIADCIRSYPDLYQSRKQVLEQLFCVLGNGYDWIDGALVAEAQTVVRDGERHWSPRPAFTVEGSFSRHERLLDALSEDALGEDAAASIRRRRQAEAEEYLAVSERAEELAHDQLPLLGMYPMAEKYADLLVFPDDIRPEWLDAAEEAVAAVREIDGALSVFDGVTDEAEIERLLVGQPDRARERVAVGRRLSNNRDGARARENLRIADLASARIARLRESRAGLA